MFPPPLWPKQIRAKSPNPFCQSYDLFALHTSHNLLHHYLILFQRMIRSILTFEKHGTALKAHQRMPPVFLHIQHPQITICIQSDAFRLVAIIVVEKPTGSFLVGLPLFLNWHDVYELVMPSLAPGHSAFAATGLQPNSSNPDSS